MNGKGSKRRPALVSEKVIQNRWDKTFGKKHTGCVPMPGVIGGHFTNTLVCTCPPKNEYSHLGDFDDRYDWD